MCHSKILNLATFEIFSLCNLLTRSVIGFCESPYIYGLTICYLRLESKKSLRYYLRSVTCSLYHHFHERNMEKIAKYNSQLNFKCKSKFKLESMQKQPKRLLKLQPAPCEQTKKPNFFNVSYWKVAWSSST